MFTTRRICRGLDLLHGSPRWLSGKAVLRGGSSPPLIETTMPTHFASLVEQHGERTAVISSHQNRRLTYTQLDTESTALAHGLFRLGVRKGDRVAVSLGNTLEHAILTYSLFKLGAILAPLNPAFTETQTLAALRHIEAGYYISGTTTRLPRREPYSNTPLLKRLLERETLSRAVPSLKEVVVVDNDASSPHEDQRSIDALLAKNAIDLHGLYDRNISTGITANLHKDDVVNIQFTSGTTSMPKAACLTHRSILNNGKSIGDRMKLTPSDIICCPPPLFHCFGCILGYMATITHGSAIVFPSEAFDPFLTMRAVQTEKCTGLYGVPTMFLSYLELLSSGQISSEGLSQLRTGIAAGSSIPAELMRRLHSSLNLHDLVICYGMTETSPVSVMTSTEDPMQKRIETVGTMMPHVNAKVVSPMDRSRIQTVGERGELVVSGYLVMKEYWGDRAKTEEAIVEEVGKDGEKVRWMHTGDEAFIDEDGYVHITGRIKDIIIRGGENIHPLEIENVLLAHESVRDASVVGVPNERYGEVVAAFIIPNNAESNDEEDGEMLRDWIRERLSKHLVPKHVFFVQDFPKTASGKIQKFKLREDAIALLVKEK